LRGTIDYIQNTHNVPQRSLFDDYGFAGFEEGPRLNQQARIDDCFDSRYFEFVNLQGHFSRTYEPEYSRDGQDRKSSIDVQPAENISGEKREVNILKTVGPTAPAPVQRQERVVASLKKCSGDCFFMPGAGLNRVPRVVRVTVQP
jgi:hypothetical protein